jgi:hypothetical protein
MILIMEAVTLTMLTHGGTPTLRLYTMKMRYELLIRLELFANSQNSLIVKSFDALAEAAMN